MNLLFKWLILRHLNKFRVSCETLLFNCPFGADESKTFESSNFLQVYDFKEGIIQMADIAPFE